MRPPAVLAGVAATIALAAGGVGVVAATPAAAPSPGPLSWEQWQHLPGVFDLGVQADGAGLIAQGSTLFFKVDRAGSAVPINGQGGYSKSGGFEAYFAVSHGEPVGGSCRFQNGAIYVIDPTSPKRVLEVDPNTGRPAPFATLADVDSLNGIAFDGGGSFGEHPLLVTGPRGGRSEVAAIDCHGGVKVITDKAPRLEGGIAVAPSGFGGFGGNLVAPDELSGDIIAVNPDGPTSTVARYKTAVGQDIGVESAGFVPRDFLEQGGAAYLSDRGTTGSPHPGTDSILRLTSAMLRAAGVNDGDLLVATEASAETVVVACGATCSVRLLATGPPPGHIEGRIVFLADHPGPGPPATAPATQRPRPSSTPRGPSSAQNYALVAPALAAVGVAVIVVAVVLLLRRRAGDG